MDRRVVVSVVAACGLLGQASVSLAAESPEEKVLTMLNRVNQMEIQAGELAQQKAQSDEVRRYGERVTEDHRQSNNQVRSLAKMQGIQLPASDAVEAKHQDHQHKVIEQLRNAKGADFDREFMKIMATDHDQALSELKDAQAKLTNEQVRDLVEKTIPVLERHQQQAQQLQQSPDLRG